MIQPLYRYRPFRFSYDLPELLDIQRASFTRFLGQGIIDEFSKLTPLRTQNEKGSVELVINSQNFQFLSPDYTPRDCLLRMKTYSCKLYVQAQMVWRDSSGKVYYQTPPEWVLLGHIPLMTKRGHFIINGSPRIVVHQVVRSPGIYFQEMMEKGKRARFYGDIIPRRGVWVRLQITAKGKIEARFKKGKKVSADMLQRCLQAIERSETIRSQSVHAVQAKGEEHENVRNSAFKGKNTTPFLRQNPLSFTNSPPRTKEERASLRDASSRFLPNTRLHHYVMHAFVKKSSLEQLKQKERSSATLFWKARDRKQILSRRPGTVIDSTGEMRLLTHTVKDQKIDSQVLIARERVFSPMRNTSLATARRDQVKYTLKKREAPRLFSSLRAESLAENEAFAHTYDKLYRPAEDKEREELAKKEQTQALPREKRGRTNKADTQSTGKSSSSHSLPQKGARLKHFKRLKSFKLTPKRINDKGFKRKQCAKNLWETFKISSRYDLGALGREKINTKLGISVLGQQLTAGDIHGASQWLLRLNKGSESVDDIDNSQNRRIRTSGELLQMQLENGVERLKRSACNRLKDFAHLSGPFSLPPSYRYPPPSRSLFAKPRELNTPVQAPPLKRVVHTTWGAYQFKGKGTNKLTPPDQSGEAYTVTQGGVATGRLLNPKLNLNRRRRTESESQSFSDLRAPLVVRHSSNPRNQQQRQSKYSPFIFSKKLSKQKEEVEQFLSNAASLGAISLKEIISTKAINGAFREFFGSNPLSQYMDQINPLSEITHKRRMSSLGVGGVSRESAGMAIRGIHPTHYGRICPIETPEGKNAGLVNSLAFYARVDPQGFLETPCYRVIKGQLQQELGFSFFSAKREEEAGLRIAASDALQSWNNVLATKTVPIRIAENALDLFTKTDPYKLNSIGLSSIQMMSVATSLIPFLEHNDANRALMGSNMQRQAVPLMIPERPLVGTGLEALVVAESGHILQARSAGFVSYASAHKIVVERLISPRALERKKAISQKRQKRPIRSGKRFLFSQNNRESKHFVVQSSRYATRKERLASRSNNPKQISIDFAVQYGNTKTREQNIREPNLLQGSEQTRTLRDWSGKLLSWISQSQSFSLSRLNRTRNTTRRVSLTNPTRWGKDQDTSASQKHTKLLRLRNLSRSTQSIQARKSWRFHQSQFQTQSNSPLSSHALTPTSLLLSQIGGKKRYSSCFISEATQRLRTQRCRTNSQNSSQKDLFFQASHSKIYSLIPYPHFCHTFDRSNQDTCLIQKPLPNEGEWVQRGDLLTDCSASNKGEFSVGKNILVAYLPWEGFNFEDAIVVSERLVHEHVFTSLHIERYDYTAQESKEGKESLTNLLPGIPRTSVSHLNKHGLPKVGSFVQEGDILVGKIRYSNKKPTTPYERLLGDILGRHNLSARDASLYVPRGVSARVMGYTIMETTSRGDAHTARNTSGARARASANARARAHARESARASAHARGRTRAQAAHRRARVAIQARAVHSPSQASRTRHTTNTKSGQPALSYQIHRSIQLYPFVQEKTKLDKQKINNFSKSKRYHYQNKKRLTLKERYDQREETIALTVPSRWWWTTWWELWRKCYAQRRSQSQGVGANGELPIRNTIKRSLLSQRQQNYSSQKRKPPLKTALSRLVGLLATIDQDVQKQTQRTQDRQDGSHTINTLQDQDKISPIDGGMPKDIAETKAPSTFPKGEEKEKMSKQGQGDGVEKMLSSRQVQQRHKAIGRHKQIQKGILTGSSSRVPKTVNVFLAEKRVLQIGDKMSGRHGNKGVVSTILPRQDMPYLGDGSAIDIVLNPLGVPSRMNVGQVYECLLGLAGTYLHQHLKLTAFDEMYGAEASQSLVYLKLYQARLQSGQNWLFQINYPGKTRLVDGRSGECFDQWVTVGKAYILKLIHMVNDKIHARATGPYALITQQPLRGRSHKGGQRLGEMEVWALEGFGAAYTLQELLTKKSDDVKGRKDIAASLLPRPRSLSDTLQPSARLEENKLVLGQPEIFKVLVCELQALCLDVGVYSLTNQSFQRTFLSQIN